MDDKITENIDTAPSSGSAVNMLVMCDDFEQWLRMTCFQEPPKHCYKLAKAAWNQAVKMAAYKAFDSDKSIYPADLGEIIETMISDT